MLKYRSRTNVISNVLITSLRSHPNGYKKYRNTEPYPTTDQFNNLDWLKSTNRMPINILNIIHMWMEILGMVGSDLYRDLDTFRITGGTIVRSRYMRVLDYIIDEEDPNRELNLSINTNLGIPDKLVDRFIEKINRLEDGNKVKSFVVYTSVEGWGEQANTERNGLVFSRFWDNMNKILTKCPTVTIGIMSTYNAICSII